MSGVIVGILLLSLIMILHEIGHFATGRRLGFKVMEFSLFMGPILYSRVRNGIRYSLRLFPIGASCRFAGEEGEDGGADAAGDVAAIDAANREAAPSNEPVGSKGDLFFSRPRWARAIVLTAGAAMNYLSGLLVFFILFAWFGFVTTTVGQVGTGSQAADGGLLAGERIVAVDGSKVKTQLDFAAMVMFLPDDKAVSLTVESVETGVKREVQLVPRKISSYRLGITVDLTTERPVIAAVDPASNGGNPVLLKDDILVSVNGVSYTDQALFAAEVNGSKGAEVTVRVLRGGQEKDLAMKPVMMEYYNPQGIQFVGEKSVAKAAWESVRYSWSIVRFTVKGISMMIAGQISAKDSLSGPIGIVSMVGSVVDSDEVFLDKIYGLLSMFGLISINLAFMNLLPIPPLDGNHLLLTGLEAIRGKRLSIRTQTAISVVGFTLLIALAIVAVVFDIMRLAGN